MQYRTYRSDLGSLRFPDHWLDKTTLAFAEPPHAERTVGPSLAKKKQFRANIVVAARYPSQMRSLEDTAAGFLHELLQNLSAARLLAKGPFSFANDQLGWCCELAQQSDGMLLTQHFTLLLAGPAVYVFTTTCDAERWPALKDDLLASVASFEPPPSSQSIGAQSP
jgi:hypothetical protein